MTTQCRGRTATRASLSVFITLILTATSSAAEPIRILVVTPREPGKLAQQVHNFEDALQRSHGRIARATSLSDADAVVEFTAYRRVVVDKGTPQDRWYGQYVLLRASADGTHKREANRFALVVIDREDWQVEPALDLLATTLSRALGSAASSADDKSL